MNETPDAFDFIINDEDEVMLLLYARESEPKNAVIEIDGQNFSAVLHRNETDAVAIDRVPDDVLDSLADADTLLVCELTRGSADRNGEDDTEIKYAYEADIDL